MTTATPDHAKAQAEQRRMAERGDVLQRVRVRLLDLNDSKYGCRSEFYGLDPAGFHNWPTRAFVNVTRYDADSTFPKFDADGWSEPFVTNSAGLSTLRQKSLTAEQVAMLIPNAKIAIQKHDSDVRAELEKHAGESLQMHEHDRIDARKRIHAQWVATPMNYYGAIARGTSMPAFQPYCEIELLDAPVPVEAPEEQEALRIAKATARGASAAPADLSAVIEKAVAAGIAAGLAAAQPKSHRKDA